MALPTLINKLRHEIATLLTLTASTTVGPPHVNAIVVLDLITHLTLNQVLVFRQIGPSAPEGKISVDNVHRSGSQIGLVRGWARTALTSARHRGRTDVAEFSTATAGCDV